MKTTQDTLYSIFYDYLTRDADRGLKFIRASDVCAAWYAYLATGRLPIQADAKLRAAILLVDAGLWGVVDDAIVENLGRVVLGKKGPEAIYETYGAPAPDDKTFHELELTARVWKETAYFRINEKIDPTKWKDIPFEYREAAVCLGANITPPAGNTVAMAALGAVLGKITAQQWEWAAACAQENLDEAARLLSKMFEE